MSCYLYPAPRPATLAEVAAQGSLFHPQEMQASWAACSIRGSFPEKPVLYYSTPITSITNIYRNSDYLMQTPCFTHIPGFQVAAFPMWMRKPRLCAGEHCYR